jgi:hypothetical protein
MYKIIEIIISCLALVMFLSCCYTPPKGSSLAYFSFYVSGPNGHDEIGVGTDIYGQFSNLYLLWPKQYDDFLNGKVINLMNTVYPLKIFLYIESAVYSGNQLLPDYNQKLAQLQSVLAPYMDRIAFLYLYDEAMVSGMSNADLATGANAVKQYFPNTKLVLTESGLPQYLNIIQVPQTVDVFGVGYGYSNIINPVTDPDYQAVWANMKSKLSAGQQIVVIAESQICPNSGLTESDVVKMAQNYYNLALSDNRTVMLLGFSWNDFPDQLTCTGASDLPGVIAKYKSIGLAITGNH